MISYKKILFLITVLAIVAGTAFADSFYSSMGLGLPNYYVSPRAVAMGGAGIAVNQDLSVNIMNPAAVNILNKTTVSVESYMEQVDSKYKGQGVFTRNGNPSGFHFFVPIRDRFVFIAGLQAVTRSRYDLSIQGSTPYVDYERIVSGSGGLSAGTLGLKYQISPILAVGVKANFNFGTFSEKWTTRFEETSYADATDEVSSHMWGTSVDFGLWLLPFDSFSMGIVYQSAGKLNIEENVLLGSGMQTPTLESDVTMPQALGIGGHYALSKVRIAADFYTRFWDQYKRNGVRVSDYSNYVRYGAGVEYLDSNKPNDRYLRRIAYRLGAYYAQLPFSSDLNDSVHEQFITTGFSLPFHGNAGRLDLALEIGTRSGGSFGYDENVIRVGASLCGSELWFLRHR